MLLLTRDHHSKSDPEDLVRGYWPSNIVPGPKGPLPVNVQNIEIQNSYFCRLELFMSWHKKFIFLQGWAGLQHYMWRCSFGTLDILLFFLFSKSRCRSISRYSHCHSALTLHLYTSLSAAMQRSADSVSSPVTPITPSPYTGASKFLATSKKIFQFMDGMVNEPKVSGWV